MARKRGSILLISVSINVFFGFYLFSFHLFRRNSKNIDLWEENTEYLVMSNATFSTAPERKHIKCYNKERNFRITQHGHFLILNNYVMSSFKFKCSQSITFTTHSDYTYLDNLLLLLKRWDGPVSIALHAPGADFGRTVRSVMHLRRCGPKKVMELVTFHIYFRDDNLPVRIPQPQELHRVKVDCSSPAPYVFEKDNSFRLRNGIPYPVNVGRNVARENAMTHYVLASDIELFPAPQLIDKFLKLVDTPAQEKEESKLKVYPLPVFEVASSVEIPQNKTELVKMIRSGSAQIFHKVICPSCHRIPFFNKWLNMAVGSDLNVFHVAKRQGSLDSWEPIYIGTNNEPFYDERLSWEGKRDKMAQSYIMCVLDYEFHILDNAFLTHRPGIKKMENNFLREYLVRKTFSKVYNVIYPELKVLFGDRDGCKF